MRMVYASIVTWYAYEGRMQAPTVCFNLSPLVCFSSECGFLYLPIWLRHHTKWECLCPPCGFVRRATRCNATRYVYVAIGCGVDIGCAAACVGQRPHTGPSPFASALHFTGSLPSFT